MAKDKSQLFKLLDTIDFRFATLEGRDFVHPNILLFISKDLKIVKYLYGVNYDPVEVRIALSLARGEKSLLAQIKPFLFFIGFAGLTITSILLIFLISRSRTRKTTHSLN
jgi:protein SCO1/2